MSKLRMLGVALSAMALAAAATMAAARKSVV